MFKNFILKLSAILAITFSFYGYAANPSSELVYSWKMEQTVYSDELITLDKQIQELQLALEQSTGIQQIYICGGAARAILDHIYMDKPLKMRDLDIAILAHRKLNGDEVRLVAQSLEQLKIGALISNSFDFRPRLPTSIPFQPDTEYYAGYGFFLLTSNGMILDLSFFENEQDFELNGLMDIDTVKILLQRGESLIQFVEKAQKVSLNSLILEENVLDPFQGYSHWIMGDPSIIHWETIEADPHLLLFRLVRSYRKANLIPLPKDLWRKFHNLCASTKPKNSRRMSEHLLRVLNDESAHKELKLLQELGVFQHWLPELSSLIENKSSQDLAIILDNDLISPLQKLMLLVTQMPNEKRLETWFKSIYKFDLNMAIERSFDLIAGCPNIDKKFLRTSLEKVSPKNREELENQILRIVSSTVLSNEERFDLIIRSIALAQNINDPVNFIQNLIPDVTNERSKALVDKIKGKRKGFMTGVFDPIQNGHLAIINTAIEQLVLDEVLLIPVEVDNTRSTAPWQDRVAMIDSATKNIPEIRLPSYHHHESIKNDIGNFIEYYKETLQPEDPFWHIMGSDACERYAKYGLLEKEKHPLFILYRPGYPISLNTQNVKRPLTYLNWKECALDVSCNDVRTLVRAKRSVNHLVPDKVADYINKRQLYTLDGILAKPFYLADRDEALYKAAKHYLPTIRKLEKDIPFFYGEEIQSVVESKLEYAQKEGFQDLIIIETSLSIDNLKGFPGTMTGAWMKKISPQEFQNLIRIDSLMKAQLEVVVGFLGSHGEKVYININSDCNLQTLMENPSFHWENLFYKPLPSRELSLVDIAITRLVRNLLSKSRN